MAALLGDDVLVHSGSRPVPSTTRRWRSRLSSADWIAAAIVAGGALLRLYRLDGRSLWLDEILTARAANLGNVLDVVRSTRADDQMPLFNVITWALRSFGGGEFNLRFPSAVFGMLSILALYLLGKSLFGTRVGLLAAFLIAVMPFAIWYAQEARPYALLMLATTCQMLFAYWAITRARLSDWLGLGASTLVNLYTHYMALAATLAVALFVTSSVLVAVATRPRDDRTEMVGKQPRWHGLSVMPGAALATTGLVIVGYLPWARTLWAFLHRPGQGFGRTPGGHLTTLADVQAFLAQFGFAGIVLALVTVGLIASLVWALRGRAYEVGLLLCWLGVPLVALSVTTHGGLILLLPRYLSFLFPAACLLVAIGIAAIGSVAGALLGKIASLSPDMCRRSAVAATLIVTGVVVIVGYPYLLHDGVYAYDAVKDDYRGVADRVIADSPPDSVVLAVGRHSDFVVISLGYYLKLRRSPITVVAAGKMTATDAHRLYAGQGTVWAAVFTNYPNSDFDHLPPAGLEVTRFVALAIVREPPPAGSMTTQAVHLLRWASAVEPDLTRSAGLLSN